MAVLYDYHLHSSFSWDGRNEPDDMCRRAVSLGLSGICFTEHMDADYPELPSDVIVSTPDLPACMKRGEQLKEHYRGVLRVGTGIELGMQLHLAETYRKMLKEYPFDFAAASMHLLYGEDHYYPVFWERHPDIRRVFRDYYRLVLQNLVLLEDFDSCAHLDYIIRYVPAKMGCIEPAELFDVIDPVLQYLIDHDKCLEVNTSPLSSGKTDPNPSPVILARYHALGGRKITIGSDAHVPDRIASGFDKAAAILKSLGFTEYRIFYQRKEESVPL